MRKIVRTPSVCQVMLKSSEPNMCEGNLEAVAQNNIPVAKK